MINFFILFLFSLTLKAQLIEPDFTKANINQKYFEVIPKNTQMFLKNQAYEPAFFVEKELRGFGWMEPFFNITINELRQQKNLVYVDYLTSAKFMQYIFNTNYKACVNTTRKFAYYKNKQKNQIRILRDYKKKSHHFVGVSVPFILFPAYGRFMILEKKLEKIKKHLYPGSEVYNIVSMLNDPDLYTAQMTNTGSAIKEYIYNNIENNEEGTKKEYKKRVYDFVASKGEQLTFMIAKERMHWVDSFIMGDYHYMKNKNILPKILFLPFTHNKSPAEMTKDDHSIAYFTCFSNNLKELKQTLKIINTNIKKIRTNEYFLSQILKVHGEKTGIKYEKVSDFYYFKQNILSRKLIDSGYYDIVD